MDRKAFWIVTAMALALGLFWGRGHLMASPPAAGAREGARTPVQQVGFVVEQGIDASGGGGPGSRLAGAGIARNLVFVANASGQLVLDSEVLERLTALLDAEHSDHDAPVPEQIASAGLGEAQAAQALQMLTRLRALRASERSLFTKPGRAEGIEGAAEMLEAQRALRREHFGADAERLFGEEESRVAQQIRELRAVP